MKSNDWTVNAGAQEHSLIRTVPRPAVSKPAHRDGISPAFVLHAVRRWWKVAAPLGILLAAVSAGAVFLLFKPMYMAVGNIRILEKQPSVAFPVMNSDDEKYVQTQLQSLKFWQVLRPCWPIPRFAGIRRSWPKRINWRT